MQLTKEKISPTNTAKDKGEKLAKELPWLAEALDRRKTASQAIERHLKEAHSPRIKNLAISMTLLCNQGCRHCWVDAARAMNGELSNDEITSVLRQASELGAEHVKFTGGEPLARQGFSELVLAALKQDLRISVETNGTLVTPTLLGKLSQYRERIHFYVNLDGNNGETHDNFRNSPGSFNRTLQALQELKKQDFLSSIHSVCNKININEMKALHERVRQRGAKHHKIILSIHPLGRALRHLVCNPGWG